ncbi:MAG: NAD(P)-binding domain-containing protein, partial [Spirochaetales bacterium]|nr:NAD(P)-binding domain-containing protein [Spirochaetales bacterium]
MARISVIGAGNMGGAFAEALSKRKDISLCIYDSCRPCADKIAGTKANVTVLDSMDQARGSDVVVIAVKPQVLPQIYDQLSALKPGFFISIAAGVTLEKLTKNLTSEKVVRFMPNIAAKIGHAVTAVAYSPALSSDERKTAMDIALS